HVETHGGTVVRSRGEGDSSFAVFVHATDAVRAVSSLQAALSSEPWPDEVPIRIRAALHTGVGEITDRDYNSAAVNRCARLRSIGWGAQTLLSRATYELVRDEL